MKTIHIFKTYLLIILLILCCTCKSSTKPEEIDSSPEENETPRIIEPPKILFIGSSYFISNNLLSIVRNLADSGKKEIFIDWALKSGTYLSYHAASAATEKKIREQKWDYVILQGVGRLMAYPEVFKENAVYPALKTLNEKILSNSESTKVVFCLPWAYEDGMAWAQGWTDLYPDMQEKIYNNTLKYADDIGLMIAPVGWAWYKVLKEKKYPLHYLHLSDWNHPSLKGTYLMACVIYSTIFKESTIGIEYYANIAEEEASYFQKIASNTVLDDLELWRIE